MKTRVIFRKFRSNGEVIALFPDLPGTSSLATCSSYLHVGQHNATSVDLSPYTGFAKPADYRALREELEHIGYVLDIRQRAPRDSLEKRRQALIL